MSLTARVAFQDDDESHYDPEDFLSSALGTLYHDDVANLHGGSGQTLVYASPHLREPMLLRLSDPVQETDRRLFSHYLWNASLLLAELIEADTLGICEGKRMTDCSFDVKNRRILELGAGTGLAGIMAGLLGAKSLTLTEYPSEPVLKALRDNVSKNLNVAVAPAGHKPTSQVAVEGHEWGIFSHGFSTRDGEAFDVVMAADVFWMPWEHDNLRRSLAHFLSRGPDARCWLVAGLHTGRDNVARFFQHDFLDEVGLELEHVWERDCDGLERAWQQQRENDWSNRKRWLILAVLKRIGSVPNFGVQLGLTD